MATTFKTLLCICMLTIGMAQPALVSANANWLDFLPLHISAISSCQQHIQIRYPEVHDMHVVDLRPMLQEAEADFRFGNTMYTCRVGVYGGETQIQVSVTDKPLPDTFFTLLPGYPDQTCYDHELIYNYNFDPPEIIGWISIRMCR